jgi:hypothetical protein
MAQQRPEKTAVFVPTAYAGRYAITVSGSCARVPGWGPPWLDLAELGYITPHDNNMKARNNDTC